MDERALAYDGFAPREEGLRAAPTSPGNGYVCAHVAAAWEDADGVHYSGTYAHGPYHREMTIMGGWVLDEGLVDLPRRFVLTLTRSLSRRPRGFFYAYCH